MEWTKLLLSETQVEREKKSKKLSEYSINDIEIDYEKIISSSAFRRLQDKTQVFPLDKNDFVRTRLTHSIEVSSIARQLGIMAMSNTYIKKKFKNMNIDNISPILACAGLLHDIGNPPFGHFGEVIIGDWFKKELEKNDFCFNKKPIKEILNIQMKKDLENFEGNAQALRILTKKHSTNFMNLSYSILNTLIKYPTNSIDFSSEDEDVKKHKLGYYYSENNIVKEICETTGTKINEEYVRHPLTFLLEAADDIAYATADLEDALKKGLFTLDQFIDYFKKEVDKIENKEYPINLLDDLINCRKNDNKNIEKDFNVFNKWIYNTKKWLMYVVVFRFSNSYNEIMDGSFKYDLFYDTYHKDTIKILKGAIREFVFNDIEILKLEISAKKIIESFLNDFIYAVIYWEEDPFKSFMSKSDKKYINIIPQNLKDEYIQNKNSYKNESDRLYNKFMMVTDFISGMTDSYARNLYQELYSIK